jgi:hypothetical protein
LITLDMSSFFESASWSQALIKLQKWSSRWKKKQIRSGKRR